jgi:D-alanyl-D-alanine dipeptidase
VSVPAHASATGGRTHRDRLAAAARSTGEAGLAALLVAPSPDLWYLTRYDPPPLERLTLLVIRPSADPVLVVPRLERPLAAASTADANVEVIGWRDSDDPYDAVARMLSTEGDVAVGDRLWASHVLGLQRAAPRARLVASSAALPLLRAVKDAAELRLLARAGHGADEAFAAILGAGLEGRTEADIGARLDELLHRHGHDETNFTIVGSGPNGASPHHEPTERRVAAGEPVVLDFGGRVQRYCSDLTRTVAVGRADSQVGEVHAVVRKAQDAAFRAVRPGVPAEDVDAAARAVIDAAGFSDAFFHRTGHGIGLEEHEPPYIVRGNREPLFAGMTFSIEPGIYLDGRFGVRIEDIVAVTDDGAERLNHARRDLIEVG